MITEQNLLEQIKNNDENVKNLSFESSSTLTNDLNALALALRNNTTIEYLGFSKPIDQTFIKEISSKLQKITYLKLNIFFIGSQAFEAIMHILAKSNRLKGLFLYNLLPQNILTLEKLVDKEALNVKSLHVTLARNTNIDGCEKHLVSCIHRIKALKSLSLNNGTITGEILNQLAENVLLSENLKHLNLDDNLINDNDITTLTHLANHVTFLSLADNNITNQGLEKFAEALGENQKLRGFDISCNKWDEGGFSALMAALVKNKTLLKLTARPRLPEGREWITEDLLDSKVYGSIMEKMLENNKTLVSLAIECVLDNNGFKLLIKGLMKNFTLRQLNVGYGFLVNEDECKDEEAIHHLVKLISTRKQLVSLNMLGRTISKSAFNRLIDAADKNSSFSELVCDISEGFTENEEKDFLLNINKIRTCHIMVYIEPLISQEPLLIDNVNVEMKLQPIGKDIQALLNSIKTKNYPLFNNLVASKIPLNIFLPEIIQDFFSPSTSSVYEKPLVETAIKLAKDDPYFLSFFLKNTDYIPIPNQFGDIKISKKTLYRSPEFLWIAASDRQYKLKLFCSDVTVETKDSRIRSKSLFEEEREPKRQKNKTVSVNNY